VRGLTFRGKARVAVESVADPRIESPGDAILQVELAGICGSDLHPYHERERGLDHGTVMGHEYVGRIVELGSGVAGLARGERVLGPFSTSCGSCFYCRRGLTARCVEGRLFGWVQDGAGLQGAQAEFLRVPLAGGTLVRVPQDLTDIEALLLGDVLATGYYGARRAGVEPGSTVAVVGCGPVGALAAAAAVHLGAARVLAIDPLPERRALAAAFGAEPLDPHAVPAADAVRAATDGRGADAVVEAAGGPAALALAVDLARPGGTVAAVAVHTEAQLAFSPAQAYDKNLTYRSGRCPARALIDELLPLVRRRRHDLSAVVSHRLPLADAARGYALFDRREDGCTKVALVP
jgi:threonine dehydrogenase-like Zn-dependent dehydrogenase